MVRSGGKPTCVPAAVAGPLSGYRPSSSVFRLQAHQASTLLRPPTELLVLLNQEQKEDVTSSRTDFGGSASVRDDRGTGPGSRAAGRRAGGGSVAGTR